MIINTLKRKNPYKKHKSVGRGGAKGKNAGRGNKGQKSRAGHRMRPEVRDIIKKIPKLRGHGKNRARTVIARIYNPVINVADIEKHFANGDTVNIATLVAKNLVTKPQSRANGVKVLGDGTLTKKVTISGCTLSKSAKEKIEKAGGTVEAF